MKHHSLVFCLVLFSLLVDSQVQSSIATVVPVDKDDFKSIGAGALLNGYFPLLNGISLGLGVNYSIHTTSRPNIHNYRLYGSTVNLSWNSSNNRFRLTGKFEQETNVFTTDEVPISNNSTFHSSRSMNFYYYYGMALDYYLGNKIFVSTSFMRPIIANSYESNYISALLRIGVGYQFFKLTPLFGSKT